jgi:cyclohexanone monooxygenase
MATGCLSAPLELPFEGVDRFEGPVYRTSLWPKEEVDLSGKRVGIIGTGSSGVQCIPVIAEQADHLHVFQRTPTYTFPAENGPLDPEFQRHIKQNYPELRKQQRESDVGISSLAAGGLFTPPIGQLLELSEEEREEAVEQLGFSVTRSFTDVRTDPEANEMAAEMYREAIRRYIDDPAVADRLSPRNYPIGCKRQVIDSDYFATFNRSNVTLVDLREGAIEEITAKGLRTENAEYAFDVLVFATGFDAMTGALLGLDIRGRDGLTLRDAWSAGPRTYLGLGTVGFPNLFTITGPGSPSVLSNMVPSIEQHVNWIGLCIDYMRSNGATSIEATLEAQDAWVDHVNELAGETLYPSCNSWYLGANIPGKPRVFMPYLGFPPYVEKCNEVASKGYEGFELYGSD